MSSILNSDSGFNLHGHRGCRGLMPENTIPAFIKAVDLGAKTLEMDVAVSAEGELIASHEPYFSADICLDPLGNEFSEHRAHEFRILDMKYSEIEQFDCGSKPNPRFPDQASFRVSKPRVADLIDAVDDHCRINNLPLPCYNFELKSRPEWDDYFTPPPAVFAKIMYGLIQEKNLSNRSIVQSFDVRMLQEYNMLEPGFYGALLVDNNLSPEDNLVKLGFTPPIYSPNYVLVTQELVDWCHERDMKIYPWTVNEIQAMQLMLDMGVDGLITDYPDRFAELTSSQ